MGGGGEGNTIRPKSSFLFSFLVMSKICQHVHRLELCNLKKIVLHVYQLNEKLGQNLILDMHEINKVPESLFSRSVSVSLTLDPYHAEIS